ncbi:MAG: putative toxin-antitoxin system toxin component, PIN family [Leptolyngbyaceae cyanobacterium RU_5_1]|nr:putative toxin-antitoxin system toxin component, PIN family [Leptolyngbyaceae cyanobacterium RU_5_1]
MRIVLDTNVWVSGWLWGGISGRIIQLAETGTLTVCTSETLLEELQIVLERPKIQIKLNQLDGTVEALMRKTRQLAEVYPDTSLNVPQLRDPDDAIVLAIALIARAEAIVTGDQDLLVLDEFEGIPILTPTDFLNRYFFE